MFTAKGAVHATQLRDHLVAVYHKHFGELPTTEADIAKVVRADLVATTAKALSGVAMLTAGSAAADPAASASSSDSAASAVTKAYPFPAEYHTTKNTLKITAAGRSTSQAGLLLLTAAVSAQLNPESSPEERNTLANITAEVLCMPRRRTFQVVDEPTADAALCLAAAADKFSLDWINMDIMPGPLRIAASLGRGKVEGLVSAVAPLYRARAEMMHRALTQTEAIIRHAQEIIATAATAEAAAEVMLALPHYTFQESHLLFAGTRELDSKGLPYATKGMITNLGDVLSVLCSPHKGGATAFLEEVKTHLAKAYTAATPKRAEFTAAVEAAITSGLAELQTYGNAWSLTRNRDKQAMARQVGEAFTAEAAKIAEREIKTTSTSAGEMVSLRLMAWVTCLQETSAQHDAMVEAKGISSGEFGAMLARMTTQAMHLATDPTYSSAACIIHPSFALPAMITLIDARLAAMASAGPRRDRDDSAASGISTVTGPRTERDDSASSAATDGSGRMAAAVAVAAGVVPGAVAASGAGDPDASQSLAASQSTDAVTP